MGLSLKDSEEVFPFLWDFIYLFLERGGGGGRRKIETLIWERSIHWLPLRHFPTRDHPWACALARNKLTTCPSQDSAQPTKPHWSGTHFIFNGVLWLLRSGTTGLISLRNFIFFSFCRNLLLESRLIDISQISIPSEKLFMITPSVLIKQCETACNTFIWLKGLIPWVSGEKERISWLYKNNSFIRSHKSWIWLPNYAASSPSTVKTPWPHQHHRQHHHQVHTGELTTLSLPYLLICRGNMYLKYYWLNKGNYSFCFYPNILLNVILCNACHWF